MEGIYLSIVLAPLAAAAVVGLFGKRVGRAGAHRITIIGVSISFLLSLVVLADVLGGAEVYNGAIYQWGQVGGLSLEIGFLIDHLTALMITVVSFVSLAVHVYTIGYMADDDGYQRFFSYISLFTFAMLTLVMSNNFLQLFFGWEAVGVVSYLLIGFWFKRETAIFANMKAFLVNRIGDFGFLLGIATLLAFAGSLDYQTVFGAAEGARGRAHLALLRDGVVGAHGGLHRAVRRRHGQVGADAAARLAAGFHGRPHAHLRTDPRGHHGHRGHLHGGADVAAVRVLADRAQRDAGDRRHHGVLHGAAGRGPAGHQAHRGLLDAVPARLHDRGAGAPRPTPRASST